MLESKSMTFLSQQGMNHKLKKLSRQGWRVVSTTQNVMGAIVATLERDTSTGPSAHTAPEPSLARSSNCRHGDIQVVSSTTIKHAHLCRSCDEVIQVTMQAPPADVDPESLRTLREWVQSRPPSDALARFVSDSIAGLS